jgi:hypothetical protein
MCSEIAARMTSEIGWLSTSATVSNSSYLPPSDPLWQLGWQLYCLQVFAVKDRQKLFESDVASLCIDSRVV